MCWVMTEASRQQLRLSGVEVNVIEDVARTMILLAHCANRGIRVGLFGQIIRVRHSQMQTCFLTFLLRPKK